MIVKQVFPVTGMSCASCAASIEKVLKAQKGVVNASVNYANNNALVAYDTDTANIAQVKNVVRAIGYDILTEVDAEVVNDGKSKKWRAQATVAIIFSVPLTIIGMFMMDILYANYIMWALATPVLLYSGNGFFKGAWKMAQHGVANMDTLVAISTGVAYLYSVFNTLFPHFWMSMGLHGHVYFEASAVVITFVLVGKLLEERAKSGTSSAIKKLMGLQPKTVVRVDNDGIQETVSIAEIKVHDILLIKPGEKVAVDGEVESGKSYVDESMITGEPVPVEKAEGKKVFAGTINQSGSFRYIAEKVGADTMLAHIIKMVQEAQGSKAPVQKLVDKIAGVFVPVVMGLAAVSFAVWAVWGGEQGVALGFSAFVTVLVIACPCALGLATPTALVAGIGVGAEHNILIKDAQSLEVACKVDTLILDKTGTITHGKPEVTQLVWAEGVDEGMLKSVLYSIESMSEHPLARALAQQLQSAGVETLPITSFSAIPGGGVTGIHGRTLYFVGSGQLIASMGIKVPGAIGQEADVLAAKANTIVWFTNHAQVLGFAALADKVKATSKEAVAQLMNMGVEVYMLTGDNEYTAKAVAEEVGITNYVAGVTPAGKADFVKELQDKGKVVAMAGDGINDSQALAQADVSIAMGKGTDIAMDIAGITIVTADLRAIGQAIKLSKKTVRLIRQNLFWAFIYNVVGIPLAAGVLYPINGFLLNPMIAGAAMALSSVSVVGNSLRLKGVKL